MKHISEMSIDELVQRFTAIALSQYDALRKHKWAKYNRLFDQMEEVEAELKARDSDQRRVLLQFYEHPNPQVRLQAALAVAPKPSRDPLEIIADSEDGPEAGNAGMMLHSLDSGEFQPT